MSAALYGRVHNFRLDFFHEQLRKGLDKENIQAVQEECDIIRIDKERCSGCHACMVACPKGCIKMVQDDEGFLYPHVDSEACTNCGICERSCPILAHRETKGEEGKPLAFAAYSKDERIRMESSSGGIFSLIASYILENGGYVFGAGFNSDFEVVHMCVESADHLAQLRGSKYVQSRIGDTFKEAKELLEAGKLVLFSGTPCQIGGLYAYLNKPYDNLLTQDIICHGVPSPMAWERYLKQREKDAGGKALRVSFRDKSISWRNYSISFLFSNQAAFTKNHSQDSFMRTFISNLSLRPSCFHCAFKSIERQSDITLADFWGIEKVLTEMDDQKGTSLVIIHSEKGKQIFSAIEQDIYSRSVEIRDAIKYNSSVISSAKKPAKRSTFLKEIANGDFEQVAKKHLRVSAWRKMIAKCKRVLRKLLK